MSIEKRFDSCLVAAMALREKQIQQNFRPIIAVHKWFARRPGTLFRGLILSEFGDKPLAETFFEANDFPGKVVADPFMGGGTPLLEANRVGCDVQGFDLNPMSAWIVREEIEHLDLRAYATAAGAFIKELRADIGAYYQTNCSHYGDRNVPVKYFLWVKTIGCEQCGNQIDLFPGYLIADDTRHPKHVIVCAGCGELNEAGDIKRPGDCRHCNVPLLVKGPARRNQCSCGECGRVNSYPRSAEGPPQHRMFALEYYNPNRRDVHRGRFFKKADARDIAKYNAAALRWRNSAPAYAPEQQIPAGDETDRLHRWGYQHYREMFNARQLLGLETSCGSIAKVRDSRVRRALATNLSDLLRYQNMLCRYDTMALKSLDIFSVHGFPVGLVQCESNLLGISNGNGTNVGSGGWTNIVDKYSKAKDYCENPFEVRPFNGRKTVVPIKGEWIGEKLNGSRPRTVSIACKNASTLEFAPQSLDAVFTDPPYFGNVQYGELMDFCYVWLRKLVGVRSEGFSRESTRSKDELTGNLTQARGLEHFTEGLSDAWCAVASALKPGAPLAFTFHHNRIEAYHAVGVAILDAGLTCSITLACPAEMGGSIHIQGTGSSIVDTVFVCRQTGATSKHLLFENEAQLSRLLERDFAQLRAAGMKPTLGDIRCIAFGHVTRMGIWRLRTHWDNSAPVSERIRRFAQEIGGLCDLARVIETTGADLPTRRFEFAEDTHPFERDSGDAIPF
jgi:adenine-specific DNA methylase